MAQIFLQIRETQSHRVARKGREERQKDEKIGATWIPLGRSLLLCDHYLSLHTPQKHTYPSPLITRHTIALHKQAPQRAPVIISEDNAASYTAHTQQRANSANLFVLIFWRRCHFEAFYANFRCFVLILGVLMLLWHRNFMFEPISHKVQEYLPRC